MNKYEAIIIMNPGLNEADLEKAFSQAQDIISAKKGAVENVENWGKRKLPYLVKKTDEGFFYKVDFTADPAVVNEVKGAYNLDGNILRATIIRKDDRAT